MSSFKRRIPPSAPLPPLGTRPNSVTASIREVSTGIPSLDDILGGGQPLGTIIALLAPDPHSAWNQLLQRHWIAHGLASGQEVVALEGTEEAGKAMVEGCMWIKDGAYDDDERVKDEDEVKIAWRYEGMRKFETTVSSSASARAGDVFAHQLDLTTKVPQAVVDTALEAGQLRIIQTDARPETHQSPCDYVLQRIRGILHDTNTSKAQGRLPTTDRPVALRVAISNLGGPHWNDATPSQLLRFLYMLRSLIQASSVAVLVTFPPHLSVASPRTGLNKREDGWISKLGFICDACITFEGFGGDPALSAMFPNYHGFVRVHKAPSLHSFSPPSHKLSILRGLSSPSSMSGGGGENNLGFRCTRRRFVIETLHLDVEGGVSERRTAPPIAGMSAYEETETQTAMEPGLATVQLEGPPNALLPVEGTEPPAPGEKKKKARKAVAFSSPGTDMYDF
ncbi:hypothetical protein FRB96_004014 [Tulasnella sp. 330]|nr:hypothetical protein FRB96_004014 [Tulasnella sp. 330]KAG8872745.1 hypothetical protein FRB97_007399 [Tulasnella sp. 331]KAG8880557.1 hypothetical protein FRB98_005013 [Tulasnella sp. 332]